MTDLDARIFGLSLTFNTRHINTPNISDKIKFRNDLRLNLNCEIDMYYKELKTFSMRKLVAYRIWRV